MNPEIQPISSWVLTHLDTVVIAFGFAFTILAGAAAFLAPKIMKLHKIVGSSAELINRLVDLEKEVRIFKSQSTEYSKLFLQMQNEITKIQNTSISFPEDKLFQFNGVFYTYIGDSHPSLKNRNVCPVCLEKIPHKFSSLSKASSATLACNECKTYFHTNLADYY